MSEVYMIGDLHIGHKNILKFRTGLGTFRGRTKDANSRCSPTTVDEHDQYILDAWNEVVKKRDTVFVLGDVCMDIEKMKIIGKMKGNKILVMGNHDEFNMQVYLKYFYKVVSLIRYKGYWLSHCPIHPEELRGRKNIHGHCHSNSVPDERYFNACVEQTNCGQPILFSDIVESTGGYKC